MKNSNRFVYLLIVIITIWCIVLTTMLANKDTNEEKNIYNQVNVTGFSTDFTSIVEEHSTSIVSVNANGNISSGFVYKQDGDIVYILTSYHGVADATSYYVYFANSYSCNAELVGKNIYADLAVLKITSPYEIQALNLADCSGLKSGEFVISIGTPVSLEYDASVELGMISNPFRTIENSITVDEETIEYNLDVIQLSSNLKPGYSGSPVLNMNGEVIGMTTMSLDNSLNFAIRSNEIEIIADKLINNEQVIKYQLGIKTTFIDGMPMFEKSSLNLPVDLLSGMYVDKLSENSLALMAGVKQGDVILNINGVDMINSDNYLDVVYTETDYFEFVVQRDGEVLTCRVDFDA